MAKPKAGHVSAAWLASDAAAGRRCAMWKDTQDDAENGSHMQNPELGNNQLDDLQHVTWDELQNAR